MNLFSDTSKRLTKIEARMLDTNNDGKLEASEIMIPATRDLDRARALSTMLDPKDGDAVASALASISLSSVKKALTTFEVKNKSRFLCGEEMPSDSDISNYVAQAHLIAERIKNYDTHPNAAERIALQAYLLADDYSISFDKAAALIEVSVFEPRRTSCDMRNSQSR